MEYRMSHRKIVIVKSLCTRARIFDAKVRLKCISAFWPTECYNNKLQSISSVARASRLKFYRFLFI